jgi:hypothetical protein
VNGLSFVARAHQAREGGREGGGQGGGKAT